MGAPAQDDAEDVGFDAEVDAGSEPDRDEAQEGQEGQLAASGGFDPKRRLCPDGSCVGIIGADGKCSVCGQAG